MFVTVVSSPNALITSHMGISISIENAVNASVGRGTKGVSKFLHSFGAKVMLARNPARRYMINAPTPIMEAIIAKAVPETFIGTREGLTTRNNNLKN